MIKNLPVPVVNNKMMYNRCIIPELCTEDENKWKSKEDKDMIKMKRIQKKHVALRRKEEKIEMQRKYTQEGKDKKVKRKKKSCDKMIRFTMTDRGNDGSKRKYSKVIDEKIRRKKMTNEELRRIMKESSLIYETFMKEFPEEEDNVNRGKKGEKKESEEKE